MLEIILIFALWVKMGRMHRDRGWDRTIWMQLLVIVVYLGSLVLGSVVWALFITLTEGPATASELSGMSLYLGAYAGAAVGLSILFFSVSRMQPRRADFEAA